MKDQSKTKQALTQELVSLRQRIADLEQSESERKRAEEALRRVDRALQAIINVDEELLRATDEPEMMSRICHVIVEVAGYRLAWIGFIEHNEDKTVHPIAMAGYEEGYLDTVNITYANSEWGRGPTGTAIRTGRPDTERDILNDPRYAPWREEATRRGYASSVALPLKVNGQILGALNIYSREPDAFDEQEVALLLKLANNLAYGIASLRTRAKRKRAEEMLKASLREKNILLNEIHHRVKNNLQVISGLLNLQARANKNPALIESFRKSQDQIRSMALVHEKLYASKDFSRIGLAGYVRALSQELFQSHKINPGKIDLTIQTDGEVYVDIIKAIPCGLILNELISNALQHAFPGDGPDKLEIIIHVTGNTEIEIVICDNGLGLPDDVDIHQPQTAGLHLVNGLVKNQLDGQIEVRRDNGTEFRIKFPI